MRTITILIQTSLFVAIASPVWASPQRDDSDSKWATVAVVGMRSGGRAGWFVEPVTMMYGDFEIGTPYYDPGGGEYILSSEWMAVGEVGFRDPEGGDFIVEGDWMATGRLVSVDGWRDPEGGEWIAIGNLVARDGFHDPEGGDFLVELNYFAAEDFAPPTLDEPVLVDFPAEWARPASSDVFHDPDDVDFMQRRPFQDPGGGEYTRPRRRSAQ